MTHDLKRFVWALSLPLLLISCTGPLEPIDPPEWMEERNARLEEERRAQAPPEPPPPEQPRIGLHVEDRPLVYERPKDFELDVTFENLVQTPVVIFPALVHRQYQPVEEGSVSYTPFPGPLVPHWDGAFTLGPRETRVVRLKGMRDGDGVWALDPGKYRLTLRYVVTEALAASPSHGASSITADAAVWVGELETGAVTVLYQSRSDVADSQKTRLPK